MTPRQNRSSRAGESGLLLSVVVLWGTRFVLAASSLDSADLLLLVADGINTVASWKLATRVQETAIIPLDGGNPEGAVFVLPVLSAILTIQDVVSLAFSSGLTLAY